MRVYFDLFSGDEMLSDSYPINPVYDDAAFEVPSRMIGKGGENIDIGRGNEFGGGGDEEAVEDSGEERVNDIHDGFKLQPVGFTKKEYANYIKAYMGRIKSHLQENDPDRASPSCRAPQLSSSGSWGTSVSSSFTVGRATTSQPLAYYKAESDETPHFIFIRDGLREEKF